MAISLIVLAVIFALLMLMAAGIKNYSIQEGGTEEMIKNVFIYVVLFATLMMTIGGSISVFMAAADIVSPAPYGQSFEEYCQWGTEKSAAEKVSTDVSKPSQEELKARYDAIVVSEKERQVDRAKNNLIKSLGWIIIPLPVFIFFQRRLTAK